MNQLKRINEIMRGTQLVVIDCTATTVGGETKTISVKVPYNKISKLRGNGLTSKMLYDLKKLGTCESYDTTGNKFVYTLGERSMSTDKPKTEYVPPTINVTPVPESQQVLETVAK